ASVPRLVVLAEGDAVEIQVVEDPAECDALDAAGVPVNVTLTKIGNQFVVDPSLEEEQCQSARLTVAVNARGHTLAVQKGGRGGLLPSSLHAMLHTARHIGIQMILSLDQSLAKTDELRQPSSF
ncbi:MAG: hypothetical protein Q8P67_26780, partial [archaeon]|nr:hypothetical protein [archaeon]